MIEIASPIAMNAILKTLLIVLLILNAATTSRPSVEYCWESTVMPRDHIVSFISSGNAFGRILRTRSAGI